MEAGASPRVGNDYANQRLSPPVGGRLSHFVHEWALVTSDSWVLQTLRSGYRLEFTRAPFASRPRSATKIPADPDKRQALLSEIQKLLLKRAIEKVSPSDIVFTSTFFLTTKKTGNGAPFSTSSRSTASSPRDSSEWSR